MLGFNSGQSSWGLSTILAPIRTNTWSNVNLMRTGNKFDLYVNGSLSATKINSNVGLNVDNSVNLTLGKSSTWQSYFKGNISNFNLFNKALSPFEVYQNFNALKGRYGIPDIVTSGLTLNLDAGNPYSYNPLNTGSTTWTDISGNGNNGTLTNGTYYSGGTMVFDGVDDYVVKSNFSGLGSNPSYTMMAWMQFGNLSIGAGTDANIMWYGGQTIRGAAALDQKGNKLCSLHYADDITFSSFSPIINTPYHAVMSYDNSSRVVKLYVNGVFIESGTHSGNLNITSQNLFIGGGPRGWTGKISTPQIYNRVLSDAEITQNFNALRGRYGI
jgi:hypothetical protein